MFSFCFSQYFETDDQEFYKTKVCFILNNDVSEMDLVFAEEKYSKSGQLEKVRQRFGKEIVFIFFFYCWCNFTSDGSNNPNKRNHIVVWHESQQYSLKKKKRERKEWECCVYTAKSERFGPQNDLYLFACILHQRGLEIVKARLKCNLSLFICFIVM